MKPAITAESWKMMLTFGPRVLVGPSQVPELVTNLSGVPRHALAALALHGQQFGFTREDVQLLRKTAIRFREDGSDYMSETILAVAARHDDLADRIEALLPPE